MAKAIHSNHVSFRQTTQTNQKLNDRHWSLRLRDEYIQPYFQVCRALGCDGDGVWTDVHSRHYYVCWLFDESIHKPI